MLCVVWSEPLVMPEEEPPDALDLSMTLASSTVGGCEPFPAVHAVYSIAMFFFL